MAARLVVVGLVVALLAGVELVEAGTRFTERSIGRAKPIAREVFVCLVFVRA